MKNLILLLILSLSLFTTKSLAFSVSYNPPAEKKEVKKYKKQVHKKVPRGEKQAEMKGSTLFIIMGTIFLLGAGILGIVAIFLPLTTGGLIALVLLALAAIVFFILALVYLAKEKKEAANG